MGTPDSIGRGVVLFDGVCNLCNHSVQFIIKRDPKGYFHFAPLQSAYGVEKIRQHNISSREMESIILILDSRALKKSNAVLEIARHLNGLWPLCYAFKIIPTIIRDWLYDLVARNRYSWFGRQDSCMIPTPALKARFLE